MRKNRANNGYIGAAPTLNKLLDRTNGSLTSQKQHLSNIVLDRNPDDLNAPISNYIRPSNGYGYGASAFANLTGGTISSISLLVPGGSYSFMPIVQIGGGGAGPTSYAVVSKVGGHIRALDYSQAVESVTIWDPGDNYTTVLGVSFSAPYTGGTASGSGFIENNILTVSGFTLGLFIPGQLITGSGIADNTIIIDYGTGTGSTGTYILSNTQTFATGGLSASGAARGLAYATDGRISGISLTYAGANYTVTFPPNASIGVGSQTPGRTAVLIPNMTSLVSGYTYAPSVSFSGGVTATAECRIRARLDSITMVTGGFNYTERPTVFVDGLDDLEAGDELFFATISGGAVTEINFDKLDNRILKARYSKSPTVTVGGWTPLPSVSENEDKFVAAFAVYPVDSNFATISIAGISYQVDWGDGTTNAYTGGAIAYKQYGSSVYSGLTLQSDFRGYKTVLITATPLGTTNFRSINLSNRHFALPNSTMPSNFLDITISGPTLNSITIQPASNGMVHRMLEKIKINKNLSGNYSSLLFNCFNLRSADLYTDNVTIFSSLFSSCYVLTNVNLTDTSNVTDCGSMFSGCRNLIYPPFFNTQNVTTMQLMFNACTRLKTIPLYDTRKVTNMSTMFNTCYSLEHVPYLDTSNVTNMSTMFQNCLNLTVVPPFNTSKCTNFSSMFNGCGKLMVAPNLNTANGTNFANMFTACNGIKYVPEYNLARATDCQSMFFNAQITNIPDFDTQNCKFFNSMFASNLSLSRAPNLNTSSGLDFNQMFSNVYGIRNIPQYDLTNGTTFNSMFSTCQQLITVPPLNLPRARTIESMFTSCAALQRISEINLGATLSPGGFNIGITFTTTGLNNVFNGCSSLREIKQISFAGSTGPGMPSTILTGLFTNATSLNRIQGLSLYHSFTVPQALLGATELNEIYTNLPVVGASGGNVKTITITGNWGATGDNPMIAISKGWAVSG